MIPSSVSEVFMLAHNVYFTLKDQSPEAKQALLAACREHLSGHPGEVFFACGTREEALGRAVNDKDFDVALIVVFETIAAHDAYQVAPRHKQFIAECQPNWGTVRVFDASC